MTEKMDEVTKIHGECRDGLQMQINDIAIELNWYKEEILRHEIIPMLAEYHGIYQMVIENLIEFKNKILNKTGGNGYMIDVASIYFKS